MKSFFSFEPKRSVMRTFLACSLCLLINTSTAGVALEWDNGIPTENQTITGTEVLINGEVVGTVEGEANQFAVDLAGYSAGDVLTFTARHVGTVNGEPATSQESDAVSYTVAPALSPPVNIRIEITISGPN